MFRTPLQHGIQPDFPFAKSEPVISPGANEPSTGARGQEGSIFRLFDTLLSSMKGEERRDTKEAKEMRK